MRRSTTKILTTHVGALPGPLEAWEGEAGESALRSAVRDVVAAQLDAGTDIVNEGELTKGGNWVTFINSRLSGFVAVPAEDTIALMQSSPDWQEFADFYAKAMAGGTLFEQTASAPAVGTDSATGRAASRFATRARKRCGARSSCLKASLGAHPVGDAFLTSTAPASIEVGRKNEHYKSDEEFLYALADALQVEYETIAQAGLNVQIDDAWLPALWDRIGIKMGLKAYQRYCMVRVEALNHALRNVPEEQIRYHLCWGSWHGPHAHDIPMADMVDVMLAVKAQMYLFEAANARHEHEYTLWERVKLPKGKILAPGVVSHATTLIEHPELVSQRIQRFAKLVGRDNVVASTDCGLGLRCHPQIAWAKLKALSEGAALASRALGY